MRPRVVAHYMYLWPNGEPAGRVDRREPAADGTDKDFVQYRFDAEKQRFVAGLNGMTLPLYHADRLQVARPCYLAEGEGKADELQAVIGDEAVVTTIAGGGKARMTAEHLATLALVGPITVLADSDGTGRDAAATRSRQIKDAYADKDVRIVDFFPDRNDSRDVADFIDEGHSIDEFHTLVEKAKCVDAPASAEEQAKGRSASWILRSAAQIARDGIPDVEFDVETLIERDTGPVLFVGDSDVFKTWIALHVMRCLITGEPVFGKFAVKNKRATGVYLNFDAPKKSFDRRMAVIRAGMSEDDAEHLLCASPEGPDDAETLAIFDEHREAFVVLDCFTDIFEPDPDAEQGLAMREWMRDMRRRKYEAHECNGIIVDHARRPNAGESRTTERYYGSVQKKAALRQIWFIERVKPADDQPSRNRVIIRCEKMGDAERFAPFVVDIAITAEGATFTYVGQLSEQVAKANAAAKNRETIEPYLRNHPSGLTVAQIVGLTGLSEKQARDACKTPGIAKTGKGKATRYVLCEAADGDDDAYTNESLPSSHPPGDGNEGTIPLSIKHFDDSLPIDGNESGHDLQIPSLIEKESSPKVRSHSNKDGTTTPSDGAPQPPPPTTARPTAKGPSIFDESSASTMRHNTPPKRIVEAEA